MSRPEYQAPPEIFYNDEEALKYTQNSRMMEIQSRMTERAVELLVLPQHPCLLLDIGAGSGLSGEVLTEAGHQWVGLDISRSMLNVAVDEKETEGDMLLADMGRTLNFRGGCFDGAISVSAVQWLCNSDRKGNEPYKRLLCFFRWLYEALKKGARVALQFYPDSLVQTEMVTSAAMRCGFGGGLVVDYPNSTKAKKYFLCLWAGFVGVQPQMPQAITEGPSGAADAIQVVGRERTRTRRAPRRNVKNKDWILDKKQHQRTTGRDVRPDTKFTGRKRKDKM